MQILGLDVHKKKTSVVVFPQDPTEHEPIDSFSVQNTRIEAVAQEYAGNVAVMEATSNYFTIYDAFDEHMQETVLANPLQVSWISNSAKKTDEIDAEKLAKLYKMGELPESYVPPVEIRQRRELVRARQRLVQERTKWKNETHALLDRHGIITEKDLFTESGREWLAGLTLEGHGQYLLEQQLESIDELTEKMDEMKQKIVETATEAPEAVLLVSTPGIGAIRGLTIHAELGEIERFDGPREVVSYAGMNPVVKESADTRKVGSISKQGNPYLREAVIGAAKTAVHTSEDPYLSDFYWKLRDGRNKPPLVARVATGRKLLHSIYYMLTREEKYNPDG